MSEASSHRDLIGLSPEELGTKRWGRAIFNIDESRIAEASPLVQRLYAAEQEGLAYFEEVDFNELLVVDDMLRARTVIPIALVRHQVNNDHSGEFDGWYIGRELHGYRVQPLLLLTPEDVKPGSRPVFGNIS